MPCLVCTWNLFYTALRCSLHANYAPLSVFCLGEDIAEDGAAIGLLKDDAFIALTNFTFKLVSKVVPPPDMKEYNGFMVEVRSTRGTEEFKG